MDPEVSRACARLKNAMRLTPGDQLDELINVVETAPNLQSIEVGWIKNGLRNLGYKVD